MQRGIAEGGNETPRSRATLLFIARHGNLLLIRKKRGLGAGKINGPGGHIEPGETPLEAAVREVREEVGVTPRAPEERGNLRFQFADGLTMEVHVFYATDSVGDPVETDEAMPFWVPADALPYDRMWADDRIWMPVFLAGKFFRGRFFFEGDRLQAHSLTVFETYASFAAAEMQGGAI